MNQSKIIILSVLLIALCALGGLYWKSQQEMVSLANQLNQQKLESRIQQQEMELAQLRKASGLASEETSAPAPDASQGSSAGKKSAREIELEAELARVKNQQKQLAEQEENALLNRKANEDGDSGLKAVNQIVEAQLVGKVDSYDKEGNLLIFHAIGQPSLTNGQRLAVRRKGLIFVFLVVDELDPSSGAYFATVERNEIFDGDTNTLEEGDEIIIPPPSEREVLPDLNKNALKTDLPPIPMDAAEPDGK